MKSLKIKFFLQKAFMNYSQKTKKQVFTLYFRNSDGFYWPFR